MLPPDVLRQIRRLQLRARRAVQTQLGGEYHSAFKGAGLSFEDVREYQPGDDVRQIDWNVTARTGTAFVKRYVEERELTVILLVDVSASQRFGTQSQTKRTVAAELAALIAFSALSNNDRVGLMAFTERVERLVLPNKGSRHILRVLRDVLFYEPQHRGTNLAAALDHLNRVQKRRAIVFVISDFLDTGYENSLRRTARKHDLIAVRTTDLREELLPRVGWLQLEDAETGTSLLLDTGHTQFQSDFTAAARQRHSEFTSLVRAAQADVIEVDSGGKHFDAVLKFFRQREKRRR